MGTALPLSTIRVLDEKALELARGGVCLRLALGEALDVFAARSGHHELGFSSLSAYALERCELGTRFVADSIAVARLLERNSLVRDQLLLGKLGWSRAELIAKLAQRRPIAAPEGDGDPSVAAHASQLAWLARGSSMTCLGLRRELAHVGERGTTSVAEPPKRTLVLTIPEHDLWWFHAAEVVFQRVTAQSSRALFFECLLAEAHDTLPVEGPSPDETEQQQRLDRWRAQLAVWRLRAEQLCEAQRTKLHSPAEAMYQTVPKGELVSWSSEQLDAHIVELALRLRQRDHQLGLLAIDLQRYEVWLRLGFASLAHYARERLGVSMSLLEKRRALAARLMRLPELQAAVLRGELGHSAALLISRVATRRTARRWIERARQRTIKHLSEEVALVERVLLKNPQHQGLPPSPDTLRASLALEGEIASGRRFFPARDPESATDEATLEAYENAGAVGEQKAHNDNAASRPLQISGSQNDGKTGLSPGEGALGGLGVRLGHVRLRLSLDDHTLSLFREVERAHGKSRRTERLLRYLCEHFLEVWCPTLVTDRAYEGIYRRDGYRCSNPVCRRRDVTPHHLVFRSKGGGDEPENLTALCCWCHLEGVHGGRIVAQPVEGRIHWRIGRVAPTLVHDRDKLAA